MGLEQEFKFKFPMILKGFEILWNNNKPYNPNKLLHLSRYEESFQNSYNNFKTKINDAIGKKYLPVYRMADGEFIYAIQKYSIKNRIISTFLKDYPIFKTCWGENYTSIEIGNEFSNYVDDLRIISQEGILALHFMEDLHIKRNKSFFTFYNHFLDWMKQNNILITKDNYFSFYCVYAFFSDPGNMNIFKNRKILIIGNFNENKKAAIHNSLSNKGINKVYFYKIGNKSLLEKIIFSELPKNIDLVLVGAGVGSNRIIVQLKKLNTVCIDAGMVLECLANPELSKQRIFLKAAAIA